MIPSHPKGIIKNISPGQAPAQKKEESLFTDK